MQNLLGFLLIIFIKNYSKLAECDISLIIQVFTGEKMRCLSKKVLKYESKNFLKIIVLAVLVTLCLFFSGPKVAQAEGRLIKVAFPYSPGFTMWDENGKPMGIVVDFLEEIAKYTNWKYEYVTTDDNTINSVFDNSKFDLMGGVTCSEDAEKYYAFTDFPLGYYRNILYARNVDKRIKSYDLKTLNGMTIGVRTKHVEKLETFLGMNNLSCNLQVITDEEIEAEGEIFSFLDSGKVDLVLDDMTYAGQGYYAAASFESIPYYVVTQIGNVDLIDELNRAIEYIYDADPIFALKLYEKHFTRLNTVSDVLNETDKNYIAETKEVSVAVPKNWQPFHFEQSETHKGIVIDLLEKITEYSGLKFTYVYTDSYAEAIELVKNGEADVLGFFSISNSDAVSKDFSLTRPYAEINSILVKNRKSTYPSENLKGGVLRGAYLPKNIDASEMVKYDFVSQALADVNNGEIDFFYGYSPLIENVMQKKIYTNLVYVNIAMQKDDVCFAMAYQTSPELLAVLNKCINHFSGDELSKIVSSNSISMGSTDSGFADLVYSNPPLFIAGFIIIIVVMVVVFIVLYNQRMHFLTAQSELTKLEANSRAKSEVFSRISYELRTPMNTIVGLADLTAMSEDLPVYVRNNLEKIKNSSRYLLSLISDILDMSKIESGKLELVSKNFSLGAMISDINSMMIEEAENKGLNFVVRQEIRDDSLMGDSMRLCQVILNLLSNAFKCTECGGNVEFSITQLANKNDNCVYTFSVSDTGIGIAKKDQERIFESFKQIKENCSICQESGFGLPISSSIVRLMGGELQLESVPGEGSRFWFTVAIPHCDNPIPHNVGELKGSELCLDGVHILLAEDNDLNAEITQALLERQGAIVTRAENGVVAVKMFEISKENEYELVLMDIVMPVMNGIDATKGIRALPREDSKTVPIIAMTANAFYNDKIDAYEAGMTGFLTKPIDTQQMYEMLSNVRRTKSKDDKEKN